MQVDSAATIAVAGVVPVIVQPKSLWQVRVTVDSSAKIALAGVSTSWATRDRFESRSFSRVVQEGHEGMNERPWNSATPGGGLRDGQPLKAAVKCCAYQRFSFLERGALVLFRSKTCVALR